MKSVIRFVSFFLFILFFLLSFYSFTIFSTLPKLHSCFISSTNKILLCSKNINYLKIEETPTLIKEAILTSEDDKFYAHNGFDLKEILNSFRVNIKNRKFSRGASTITQQLVKNAFLSSDKTINRKFSELLISIYIEILNPKNLILEKYLNVVEFGPNIYGLKQGALFYFKKDLHHLSVLENSLLATALPAPHIIYKNIKKNKVSSPHMKRVKSLLIKLKKKKLITEEIYSNALLELDQFSIELP